MDIPENFTRMLEAVLGEHPDQALLPAERRSIAGRTAELGGGTLLRGEVPPAFAVLTDQIARHAHRVTEDDIVALLRTGVSEEQVFEATVAAALGAGWARLEVGLRALAASKEPPR